MSDGGKGSKPRPFSVSDQEYAERWDAIFGRKDNERLEKQTEDERDRLDLYKKPEDKT